MSEKPTVLSADEPRSLNLDWTVHEQSGVCIHPYQPDAEGKLPPRLEPIHKEGLQVGMEVLVASLLGGWHVMTIQRDEEGKLYAQGERLVGSLGFEEDRDCWVCYGLINLAGITKLTLNP